MMLCNMQSTEATAPLTYTLPELADLLGLHRVTIWRKAKEGRLPVPVLDFGGVKRVSRQHVEQFLATGIPVVMSPNGSAPQIGEGPTAEGALQRAAASDVGAV